VNSRFSTIPYQILPQKRFEDFYHSIFFALLIGSGINARAEVMTNIGRIDIVVETEAAFYIFELKIDKSADIAIDQIQQKNYASSFLNKGKSVTLAGVNFSSETKNISEWKIQKIEDLSDY
jgi:hypothetical protein